MTIPFLMLSIKPGSAIQRSEAEACRIHMEESPWNSFTEVRLKMMPKRVI